MSRNQSDPEGLLAPTVGIKRISVAQKNAAYEISPNEINKNPYGVIHGGVIYTAIDYSMGAVVWENLSKDEVVQQWKFR